MNLFYIGMHTHRINLFYIYTHTHNTRSVRREILIPSETILVSVTRTVIQVAWPGRMCIMVREVLD